MKLDYEFKSLRKLTTFNTIITIIFTVINVNYISYVIVGEYFFEELSEISLIISLFGIIIGFWWTYRANKNIHTFGAKEVYSPRMSIIWNIIPIVHIWKGYQVAKQIWRASDSNLILSNGKEWKYSSLSNQIVKIFWMTFVVYLFIAFVVSLMIEDNLSVFNQILLFILIILTLIFTFYYIKFIRQVTKWQNLKAQKLNIK